MHTSDVVVDQMESLVATAQELWNSVKPHILELGRIFSAMRSTTEDRKKNRETGLKYSEYVRQTGCPYSTAEFYRGMFETCENKGVKQDVFLALYDAGVNLAGKRYEGATSMHEVATLDVASNKAVEDLADYLREAFPVAPGPTLEQLRKEAADLIAVFTTTESTAVRDAVADKVENLAGEIRKELQRLVAALRDIRAIVAEGSDPNDPKFAWIADVEKTIKAKLSIAVPTAVDINR